MVVVDVQRDFLDASASDVASWKKAFCVSGIERLLGFARQAGWRIVHVGTRHNGPDTLPARHRRRGLSVYCADGSPGCDFIVEPQPDEVVLFKQWYSAFDADLSPHLDGISTIVWAGVATDCCIHASAFDADRLDYCNIVPIEAVSASSCDAFTVSLTGLAKSVAEIVDLDAVLAGTLLPDTPKPLNDLAARALAWYEGQVSRLGDTANLSLDEALRRLDSAA